MRNTQKTFSGLCAEKINFRVFLYTLVTKISDYKVPKCEKDQRTNRKQKMTDCTPMLNKMQIFFYEWTGYPTLR